MTSLTALERFESKFIKGKINSCWIWTAGKFTNGYGQFCYNNHNTKAHRFAYLAYKGAIPNGLLVCHSCDNPLCVNPEHLFLGTNADNMQDRDNKGRGSRVGNKGWGQRCPELVPKGETHPQARLTEADVLDIRNRFAQGGITKASLAVEFGVGRMQIARIISRERWGHV